MSLIQRIRDANAHCLANFMGFEIAGERLGFVRPAFAEQLLGWPETFSRHGEVLTLVPGLNDAGADRGARTDAVERVCRSLRDDGVIGGWRDERYPLCTRFGGLPVMLLERAAVPFFGVTAYGVHVNGFTRSDGRMRMWVGKRAMTKPTGPGKLDQMVAGGQPHGIGLVDNVVKECAEEAGVPEHLARQARGAGALSYVLETPSGLRPDVIFNFDLELPADFQPINEDGEVEEFYLMEMDEVLDLVRNTERFKFNCALVIIDFLIRHGVISPDDPDYEELVLGLRPPVRLAAARPAASN